jgi:hypothetical protein
MNWKKRVRYVHVDNGIFTKLSTDRVYNAVSRYPLLS